jgi:hypothetical protein
MAKTLSQFLTYVIYDFKRDDKNTEITQAYNDTIRHLSSYKALEGRKFTSYIVTTADREDYVLPTTLSRLLHPIRIVESTTIENGYALNKLSREEWTKRYINPNNATAANITTSMPVDYCIYENAIHLGPVPDKSTYVLEIDWARISTIQAGNSDLQELGEEWEEIIKWGTLFRLYAGMGMDDEAAKWKMLYQDQELGYPYLIKKEDDNTQAMGRTVYRDL